MPVAADWSYPTTIRFGAGRIAELGRACAAAGIGRPLFVTDAGVARLPIATQALDALRDAGLETGVFADVRPNPTEADVAAGLELMRTGRRDGVVAFGGGSAIDAAKAIALMHRQTRPIWDFAEPDGAWAAADVAEVAPVVAAPTTAGTGSEVGRAAVITDPAGGAKRVIFHPGMLPAQAILDPDLTVGLPPHLTACAGMDALAHCLEAYCSPFYHPMAEGVAVEGIRLVRENLLAAYRDGTDLEARANMMSAAAMGATAFQKGLGAIHALSHPVGALYGAHHGLINAVLMPYVLDFNRETIWDKADRLAGWLGLDGGFSGLLDFVLRLRRDLGIPHTIDKIGVDRSRFEQMAAMAAVDPTAAGNPRRLTPEDALEIYDRAIEGRIG